MLKVRLYIYHPVILSCFFRGLKEAGYIIILLFYLYKFQTRVYLSLFIKPEIKRMLTTNVVTML